MQPGEYAGLTRKFKIDRPLTEQERERQLRQKERLNIEPSDQLAVIKLNSTYLESVDRYYALKGWMTMWMAFVITFCVGFTIAMTQVMLLRAPDQPEIDLLQRVMALAFIWIAFGALFAGSFWMLSKEARRYTHYPIRLNRKTRMVHVFRQDGTVLSAKWNKLFFTLGKEPGIYGLPLYDIRGHVLAEDGITVMETFAFADVDAPENVTRHWEFLRRYMEDGPEGAFKKVKYCMPVDGRRETFRQSWWRMIEEEWFLPMRYFGFPLIFLAICGRWLAMRLGKVPVWPAEVEAACVIDVNDPYVKDARDNPSELRVSASAGA